jgi:ABC-type transporter Mla subunit MlaD
MVTAASTAQSALSSALQEALSSLPGFADELRSALDGLRGDVRAALEDATARWRQRLEEELAPQVDAAFGEVEAALSVVDEHADEAAGSWSDGRQAAERPLEVVQDHLAPLGTGIAATKEAAAQVGLGWA